MPPDVLATPRLVLRPVSLADFPDLVRLKADPGVFGQMLGGTRPAWLVAVELADEIAAWGRYGFGLFAVREGEAFLGVTGIERRADGRGPALRFAMWPQARGRGLAREAAGAALRFAHERAGLARVVAVARWDNYASRTLLGSIGMHEGEVFWREGYRMLVYESDYPE